MTASHSGSNADWQRRSLASVWHPCTQMQRAASVPPLPIARAQGPWLYDYEGARYFDCNSSWWVNLFGHADSGITAAIKDQLDQLPHVMLAGRSQLRTATAFAACATRYQWAAGGAVHGFDGVPGGLVANAHGFGGLGDGAAAGDLGQQFDAALPGQVLAVMGDPELSFELHGAGFLWAVVVILALPCGAAVNTGGTSGCVI